jgi:hypothetical protein
MGARWYYAMEGSVIFISAYVQALRMMSPYKTVHSKSDLINSYSSPRTQPVAVEI